MLALLDEEVSQIEGQEQNLKMHQVSDTSHPFFARNCAKLIINRFFFLQRKATKIYNILIFTIKLLKNIFLSIQNKNNNN